MQHQIERLQAQFGDLKGKSMDTQCASDTLDPSSHRLEDENTHKPKVKKSKKLGSNKRLASSKPRKPRTCLRWSPTRRNFDLSGQLIVSSKSESQSDSSEGCPNLFMVCRLGLFQTYDQESKAALQLCNGSLWELFALEIIILLQF
ncbi:hypothetical protein Tco_1130258 [Tanacetum coccineum]